MEIGAEHVLCRCGSISLMVHLFLCCAEQCAADKVSWNTTLFRSEASATIGPGDSLLSTAALRHSTQRLL